MADSTRQPAIPSAVRSLDVDGPFSLRKTAGPVDWGRGRWPNVHWSDDRLHWVGRRGESVVWRSVRQAGLTTLEIEGTAEPSLDLAWLADVLGVRQTVPAFDDAVVGALAAVHADLRPFADGGLWEGLLSAIAGQGVTVSSGATMLARVAALQRQFSDAWGVPGTAQALGRIGAAMGGKLVALAQEREPIETRQARLEAVRGVADEFARQFAAQAQATRDELAKQQRLFYLATAQGLRAEIPTYVQS